LEEYGDVNELLIYGSLKYLHYVQEVICHDKPNRFAAITISDDDGDYIVPYIFVCNGYFSSRLCKINLSLPQSDLGTKIWKIVNDYPELGNCCANEYDVDGESKIMLTRGAVPGFLLNHI
jgi:hypothetical protein